MFASRMATGSANTSTAWRVTDPIAKLTAPSDSIGSSTKSAMGRA